LSDRFSTPQPPSESDDASWWLRAAMLLAPLVYLDYEVYAVWARGEHTIKPAIILWWLLLPAHLAILWGALPDALYTGEYPPPPESRRFRRWTVAAPGVSYGCIFPAAMLATAAIATAVSVFALAGHPWTLGEVLAMVGGGTTAAAVLGYLLWSRPRLDVDEERRELVWRPDTPLGRPLVLPFAAVLAVEVASVSPARHHPEICWQTGTGRIVRTRLPAGRSHHRVEAIAARLDAAPG
jgi:hypothetical protein